MKFIKPFRVGDVVHIKGEEIDHIIQEVNIDVDTFAYATHRSAWWPHEHCTLIRECDAESLKTLRESIFV
jgi:hypothetical protein